MPDYIEEEFDAYLKRGRLEEGFLRLRCESCHAEKLVAFSCRKRGFCPSCGARRMAETAVLLADEILPERPLRQWVLSLPHALRFLLARNPAALTQVLGLVYRTISGHLLKSAALTRATCHTGAVTLIQRFGSALNLNIHFRMLFLDGVYLIDAAGQAVFRHVPEPGARDLQALVERIAQRIGRTLERCGHSIAYRIAVGPKAGQKLFTLQTVAPRLPGLEGNTNGAAMSGGFSLHAGVDIQPGQRAKLERLCRYVSRPPVAAERLAMTSSGQVRYQLKTAYRDATTHIVMEPLDLMARLAALVPPPRMHLTRFHGVFAPHSKLRAAVTPAHRGIGGKSCQHPQVDQAEEKPPAKHAAMTWARRLKRVFGIQINRCGRCAGKLRIIASIEEPVVIAKILAHLDKSAPDQSQPELPLGARAPPIQARLL